MESEDHFLNSFVCRCREAIKAQTNGAEAHDALDHLALGLASDLSYLKVKDTDMEYIMDATNFGCS